MNQDSENLRLTATRLMHIRQSLRDITVGVWLLLAVALAYAAVDVVRWVQSL